MRWGKQYEYNKTITRRTFALLPIKKFGQWRWLEWVEYKGHYWRGVSGTIYWEDEGWVG